MSKATYNLEQALGDGEFGLTPTQTKSFSESCMAHALSPLTPEQKSSLKQVIGKVKDDLVKVADQLQAQKNRNKEQMTLLQNDIDKLKGGTSNIANFRNGLDPAITSCRDAANIFEAVKGFTDQIYAARIELNYRLAVKQIIEKTLATEVTASQDTLSALDKILYVLN